MDEADRLIRRARPLLGTIVEIGVAPEYDTAIEAGFTEILRIHKLMSFHENTSDLAKLRRAEAGETITVDRDTVAVLRIAAELSDATGGLFNVAIGRQLVRTRFLPRMDAEHLGCFTGDASDIEIIDDCSVRLRRRLLIDLGGIAKGYATDLAVAALQLAGVTSGIVNAGGDLRVFGDDPVPIHIRNAGNKRDECQSGYSAQFMIQNCAVASSENVHDRRRINGQITTPHIGRNAHSVIANHAVTVVADTCVIADAMTKVAMVDCKLADKILAKYGGQVVRFETSKAA